MAWHCKPAILLSTVRLTMPRIALISRILKPGSKRNKSCSLEISKSGVLRHSFGVEVRWYSDLHKLMDRDLSMVLALAWRILTVSTISWSISRFTSILCKTLSLKTNDPTSNLSASSFKLSNLVTKSFTICIALDKSVIFSATKCRRHSRLTSHNFWQIWSRFCRTQHSWLEVKKT